MRFLICFLLISALPKLANAQLPPSDDKDTAARESAIARYFPLTIDIYVLQPASAHRSPVDRTYKSPKGISINMVAWGKWHSEATYSMCKSDIRELVTDQVEYFELQKRTAYFQKTPLETIMISVCLAGKSLLILETKNGSEAQLRGFAKAIPRNFLAELDKNFMKD